MSRFVNYKKRAFTLPPGCKDLIDVLAPPRRRKGAHAAADSCQPTGIKVDEFPTAGLAQVGRYVSMLLQSRAKHLAISVAPYGCDYPVTLYRSMDETPAIALVTREGEREQAIRAFFASRGIEVLWTNPQRGLGGDDAVRGLVYALPPEIPDAISLTTELLRRVYGLIDETGIDFSYYESETNA